MSPRELERWVCSPKEEVFKAIPDPNFVIVLPQLDIELETSRETFHHFYESLW